MAAINSYLNMRRGMTMARTPKIKETVNSRLLKDYASWIYCTSCNKTVAYLCYVTYDAFSFEYTCNCGSKGKVHIEFDGNVNVDKSDTLLIEVKNRLCCPKDKSPLVTFVNKNLIDYKCHIICKGCSTEYSISK